MTLDLKDPTGIKYQIWWSQHQSFL
jgi:hypothetical protein